MVESIILAEVHIFHSLEKALPDLTYVMRDNQEIERVRIRAMVYASKYLEGLAYPAYTYDVEIGGKVYVAKQLSYELLQEDKPNEYLLFVYGIVPIGREKIDQQANAMGLARDTKPRQLLVEDDIGKILRLEEGSRLGLIFNPLWEREKAKLTPRNLVF